jgi:hypothetical protein
MRVDTCEVPSCGNLAEWRLTTGTGESMSMCDRHAHEVREQQLPVDRALLDNSHDEPRAA